MAKATLKAVAQNVPPEQVKTTTVTAAVDDRFKWVEQRIKHLNDIMTLIIAVLFIGFFTLGFALAAILIQWWSFTANTQQDLKTAIEQETKTINTFNNTIDKLNSKLIIEPSPTLNNR